MFARTLHPPRFSGAERWMPVRAAALRDMLFASVRRACCGLGGHQMMLHFEPGRLSLQCVACGAKTAGWRVAVRRTPPQSGAPRQAFTAS
ncbi:MAG TPA: hypothetical protein VFK57_19945 [Vicinamibacterales bacterium]|nr:hypothetical protein [Vicinamibacterales bacterium]